jgi:hypothetical protein
MAEGRDMSLSNGRGRLDGGSGFSFDLQDSIFWTIKINID